MNDPRGHPSRIEVTVLVALALGGLALLTTAYRLDPDPRGFGTHTQLDQAPCGYLLRNGIPCPTCGMTTSFAHFANLDVAGAFRAQPLGALLFVAVVVVTIGAIAHLVAWRSFSHYWTYVPNRWVCIAVLTALVLAAWWWKIRAYEAAVG